MNIKKLFLELTKYTIPHGHESKMIKFLPKNIQHDGCGNYFMTIGKTSTIFTSHMDSATSEFRRVNHIIEGDIIRTDGETILSGDDKNGMAVMIYMIYKGVPGTYYFFQGEESGMVGADAIINKNLRFFKNYDRMISFDRRGYDSVITHQLGQRGCSQLFAESLSKELNQHGFNYKPDPTGIFTDSAAFIDIIPEVTNLSVGYEHEHSRMEFTNIKFLEHLANAVCKIDWENLPVGEKDFDPEPPNMWYY